ncbi:hypothetical protein ACFX2C_039377 [Malus domestica]
MTETIAILRGCELAPVLGNQWEAFPTLAKFLRLGNSFQGCRWSWVPRSANLAADRLASRSNTEMCNVTWVNRPPSSLVFVLNKDGLPCPP